MGQRFILAATDYFSKWVEAVPLKSVTHREAINFVQEHIIHRFGIPQTLTTDQGSVFMSNQFQDYAKGLGIRMLNSSPYYAQANGQAESSNKTLIKLIKRKMEDRPRNWHEALSDTLWVYRVSQHGVTKVSPYQLVYGHESVLPIEVHLGSTRVLRQDGLTAEDYQGDMMDGLDEVTELTLQAMREIEKNKIRIA